MKKQLEKYQVVILLHGCCICRQIGFMRLTNYRNELETTHSYHAFIMQMCMMNIFVVCFLHASCSRLIQPVEVYTNWYMMWYLKKDMICREHIFLTDASFLNGLSVIRFWVGLAIIHHLPDTGYMELIHALRVYFCTHTNFHNHLSNCMGNCMTNCVHDHMHDLFGRSRV